MSDDSVKKFFIQGPKVIDTIILAEGTYFETRVTRCQGHEYKIEKALIEEILNLKEQIRGMQRDFGNVSRLIENLENK